MIKSILITCICCLLTVVMTSCAAKDSPSNVTGSFLNALKKKDFEEAASYVSFDRELGIGGDQQEFIRTYNSYSKEEGFVLHKYKVLKASFYGDQTQRVYSIVNLEWSGNAPENQIYACDVMKFDGHWKVVSISQVEGDVPLEIRDIYRTQEDVKKAVF